MPHSQGLPNNPYAETNHLIPRIDTYIFLDQKRANVCQHFIMCWHTITLFWSRKTSVIVETFQWRFSVFMCLSGDLLIFSVRVSFSYFLFCIQKMINQFLLQILNAGKRWSLWATVLDAAGMAILYLHEESWHLHWCSTRKQAKASPCYIAFLRGL